MQTQLWCARCERIMDVDLKIKRMSRGKTKLAQLLSSCPKCRSTLHTQTMRLEAAEEALQKFEESRQAGEQETDEQEADEQKPDEVTDDIADA